MCGYDDFDDPFLQEFLSQDDFKGPGYGEEEVDLYNESSMPIDQPDQQPVAAPATTDSGLDTGV